MLTALVCLLALSMVSALPAAVTPTNSTLLPRAQKSWSTIPGSSNFYPLADSTFRPQKKASASRYSYAKAPDGTDSIKVFFEKGSLTLDQEHPGGMSFYGPGPSAVDLTTAREATVEYKIWIDQGFGWQKGGKLPGFYGGDDNDIAMTCSGGRHDTRCFSFRLMWRREGAGEVYAYVPPYDIAEYSVNKKLCNLQGSVCDSTDGISVMRGAFTFPSGKWVTVKERVRLNDAGQANGSVQLSFNGKSVISADGIIIRDAAAGRIRGIQVQTFFGGSDSTWASPKDQYVYFKDFSVEITATL